MSFVRQEFIAIHFEQLLPIVPIVISLVIAICYIWGQRWYKKRTKIKIILNALFTSKIWLHQSTFLDMKYYIANISLFSFVLSYVVVTNSLIGNLIYNSMVAIGGVPHPVVWPKIVCMTIISIILYLAYEFAYWLDHYLSHKLPFLWEFHKVHHSAEVLTPLTNFRVHLIDTIIFINFLSLIMGSAYGFTHYTLGKELPPFIIGGYLCFFFIYMSITGHLQHSQVWIPFTGFMGHIFLSPAHHQIHHSNDPIHFNKNLGAALALFDWMFGTLYMPTKRKQKLTFGVDEDLHLNTMLASTFYPCLDAIKRHVWRGWFKKREQIDNR